MTRILLAPLSYYRMYSKMRKVEQTWLRGLLGDVYVMTCTSWYCEFLMARPKSLVSSSFHSAVRIYKHLYRRSCLATSWFPLLCLFGLFQEKTIIEAYFFFSYCSCILFAVGAVRDDEWQSSRFRRRRCIIEWRKRVPYHVCYCFWCSCCLATSNVFTLLPFAGRCCCWHSCCRADICPSVTFVLVAVHCFCSWSCGLFVFSAVLALVIRVFIRKSLLLLTILLVLIAAFRFSSLLLVSA